MGKRLESLPVFPLHTVLFPYAALQLRVFEPRYKALLDFCSTDDTGFLVALIREGDETGPHADPFMVGTAVRIETVQAANDEVIEIRVRGERRVRISDLNTEDFPFMMALVEPVVEMEVPDTPRTNALVMKTRDYLHSILSIYFSRFDMKISGMQLHEDPTALSFLAADLLQADNREKQHLLEMTDTLDRLSHMIPLLEQQILRSEIVPQRLTADDLNEWISKN